MFPSADAVPIFHQLTIMSNGPSPDPPLDIWRKLTIQSIEGKNGIFGQCALRVSSRKNMNMGRLMVVEEHSNNKAIALIHQRRRRQLKSKVDYQLTMGL